MGSLTSTPAVQERAGPTREPHRALVRQHPGQWIWMRSLAALLALAAATGLVAAVFWPGHMNLDTLGELTNARTGGFTDWHSPTWSAIWRVMLLVGLRSPGWMMAANALVLMVGLYLLLRARLSRPWAVLAAVAVFVFPPVLSWDIEIGTDAWFTSSIICGFGFAARCARTDGVSRAASAVLAVLCAFLAIGARATALPAVFTLLCAVAVVALPARLRGWRRLLISGAAAGSTTVLVAGSVLGLQYPVLHTIHTHPEQATYDYDLVRMSALEGRVLLPPELYRRQDVGYLRQLSNAWSAEALLFGEDHAIPIPVDGAALDSLRRAWLTAITRDPVGYLLVRRSSAVRQLTITSPAYYAYYGAPPREYGFELLLPVQHEAAMRYVAIGSTPDAGGHPGGPLDRAWIYVLVLLLAAGVSLRGRSRADVVLGLLGAALLLYTAEILLLSPVVTFRYMYPAVTAGTALAVILAVGAARWLVDRLPFARPARPRH